MLKLINCYIKLYKKNKELKWKLKERTLEVDLQKLRQEQDINDYFEKRAHFEKEINYMRAERRILLNKLKKYEETK